MVRPFSFPSLIVIATTLVFCSQFFLDQYHSDAMHHALYPILPKALIQLTGNYFPLAELPDYYDNIRKILLALSLKSPMSLKLDFENDDFMEEAYHLISNNHSSLMVRSNFFYQLLRIMMKWIIFKQEQYLNDQKRFNELLLSCTKLTSHIQGEFNKRNLQGIPHALIFLNVDFARNSSLHFLMKFEFIEGWKVLFPLFKTKVIKSYFGITLNNANDSNFPLNLPFRFKSLLVAMIEYFNPSLRKRFSFAIKQQGLTSEIIEMKRRNFNSIFTKNFDNRFNHALNTFKRDLDSLRIQLAFSEFIDKNLLLEIIKGNHLIHLHSHQDLLKILLMMKEINCFDQKTIKNNLIIHNFNKEQFLASIRDPKIYHLIENVF